MSSKSAVAWGALTLVFLFISFAFQIVFQLAVSYFSKQLFFIAFSLTFIAAGGFFFLAKTNDTKQKVAGQAILFNSIATIKSTPTESAKDLFIIHKGT